MSERVAIVGGGISGLSTAYFALKKGYSVELYESTDRLGGLAASFDFNGLTIEKYYHFICGGDHKLFEFSRRLGIGDKIRFQPTKTALYYNGRYYAFGTPFDLLKFSPISLISRLKFGFNTVYSKYVKKWEKLDKISAKEWICRRIGEEAYNIIWHPLLKVKFEDYYDRISAAWLWHRIHRAASSRKGLFSKERMGYFLGGSQTLLTRIEHEIRELGGLIHLNSKIEKVGKKNNMFELTLDSGKQFDFDRLILAVPLPIISDIVKNLDPQFARKLSSIDFIGVVCGIFRLREKVTDVFWLNINDPRIEANGWIEYTNLNPLEEIFPDRIVYIPLYMQVEDELYSMDEGSLRHKFFNMLKVVNSSLREEDIVGFRVFKSPYGQAICPVGFKNQMPPVKTPIKSLFILDSTQVYPSDRTLSVLIELAEEMVEDNF